MPRKLNKKELEVVNKIAESIEGVKDFHDKLMAILNDEAAVQELSELIFNLRKSFDENAKSQTPEGKEKQVANFIRNLFPGFIDGEVNSDFQNLQKAFLEVTK
jgi:hypothetical protein